MDSIVHGVTKSQTRLRDFHFTFIYLLTTLLGLCCCMGHFLVVAHGLDCPTTCGIIPDQGWNPYPLRWQADSLPFGLCLRGKSFVVNLPLSFYWKGFLMDTVSLFIRSVSFTCTVQSIVLKILTDIFGFVLQLVCSLCFFFHPSALTFIVYVSVTSVPCLYVYSLCVWSSGDYIPTLGVHSLLGALVEHENLTLA